MNNTLALLRETAESWKRAGKDRDFVLGQLKQIAPQQQALVDQVIHQFFPNGHSTNSDLDTVARVEAAMGRFESIARAAIARGENRVLPIAIGGKNPAIPWVNVEPPQNDIDTMSSSEWAKRVESWVAEIAAEPTLRDLNCCVVAKDDEHLFIDSDSYREFIAGYEAYAKQPFPKTYTTSARENRAQIHFRQTDATRALGNIGQFQAGEIDLSVRQHNQYVLAEGSQHPKGSMYQRIVDASIAPMPDKLVEYIEHLKASAEKKASANSGVADGAPRNERGLIPHGHIHPWLVSEAGKLRANGCTPDEIEDILLRRAHEECQEPLDDNHIIQVARSMENYPPTSPSKPIRLSGQQTAPAAAPAVQPEPVAEPVEPAKSIKELIDENKEAYDAANKPAANDELPDVIVENGITYAIIPHGKGFKRVALDTSVACARPVFPYYVMNGTSIYENLVQPAVENSSKHAEFIFLPAVQVMLNYLSDKVSIPFQKTNLNMFLGLISPYGKFFKSTSCELAHEYMKAVGIFDTASSTMRKGGAEGKVMVDQAGSPEGFALEMQRVTGTLGHAHAILYNDELGKLVSKAAIENSSFSSDMLSWYGSALFANKIKNEKSRFSFAAGAYTFGWLWCTTDRNFNTYWPRLAGKSSGIQDRMFFVVSQERPKPVTARYHDPDLSTAKATKALIDQAIAQGKFKIDDVLFDQHCAGLNDPRSLDLLMKLALYFAVDLGLTSIDDDCFERARALVDYRNQAARFLEPIEAENPEGRLMKEILRELHQNGGRMAYRDLCRNLEYHRHGRLWETAYGLLNHYGDVVEFRERRTSGKQKTRMVGLVLHDPNE